MKKIALWGATGSIGLNTIEIILRNPEQFKLKYMSFHKNWEKALEILKTISVETVIVTDRNTFDILVKNISGDFSGQILYGMDNVIRLSQDQDVELAVNALVGEAGLLPTVTALRSGIDVALANKESLVMAGEIIKDTISKGQATVFPIDSEHSAIWQCLIGEAPDTVKKIILTASGGPFRLSTLDELKNVTVESALNHPNWKMGKKITIDSATLMNKGLEFIEAYWLYPVSVEQIDVVVHPQSIIHSLVEFIDGSLKAQLGYPDMKIPIQYALSYPDRLELQQKEFDLSEIAMLNFEKVNYELFPALDLAKKALRSGGVAPAVLNVANEYAVYAFLDKKIKFLQIVELVNEAISHSPRINKPSLDDILEAGNWAREFINEKISKREF